MADLNEQRLQAWTERRDAETRAMLATASTHAEPAGKETSEDGRCLRCRGMLFVLEIQDHLQRDWCSCAFCGTSQPAVQGVAR